MSTPPTRSAADADTWLRRFRAVLIGILGGVVAGIGALAFYTSFEAIKSYANGSKGIDPRHDWAIPLLVDSFIVVATGADLWFTTTGRRRHLWEVWWPKALLAGAAGVSFTLNVAHVKGHDWAARGVAAIPPAALILGVELLMQVLRRATVLRTERLAAAASAGDESQPVEVVVSRADAPSASTDQRELPPPRPASRRQRGKATDRRGARTEQARAFIDELRAGGRPRPEDLHIVLHRDFGLERTQARRLAERHWPATGPSDGQTAEEGAA